ncbi:gamma-tubulin complex component, putative [Pediculus humanus corporis]|uniref:Gamma-tubulin complex component, putative n=1 Tax=Pediculus humanus subsp. corporis TaxID=121224 RepID=E0VBX8_PEDHC|nr:gamma-tubulin complex component, putative [Pediculus humanus corporis]EEB10884.1 gamma-tubulin complex component, putative [Pediculus humanus corporis]
MAEHRNRSSLESTESLLKKLCFIIAEKNQDVADNFYIIMRDLLSHDRFKKIQHSPRLLSQNSSAASLSNCSTGIFTESVHDLNIGTDEELINDQKKIMQYLNQTDKNVAKEFFELSEKIQYDKNIMLSDRTASLKFLFKMGRKREKLEELIIEPLKLSIPEIKLKRNRKVNHDKVDIVSVHSVNSPTVEELFSATSNVSSSSLDSSTKSTSTNTSRARACINGTTWSNRSSTQRSSDLACNRLQSWSPGSKQLIKATDGYLLKYSDGGLSEWDIIRSIIFTWQGIEGEIFKLNSATLTYYIDDKYTMDRSLKEKAENLALLGYLHNTLQKYMVELPNAGMVRKSLIAYVREQLSDYYTLIANIQTQEEISKETCDTSFRKSLVTTERLKLLSLYPTKIFQDLISILHFTEHYQGGYLASGIHSFIEHGNPELQTLVKGILYQICKPLYSMLIKWLLDGELADPYKEFFIASNNNISGDRLWHEKYTVRISMLPKFISVSLADKILSVGKSINFLREICCDDKPFSQRDRIKDVFLNTDVEVMYLLEKEDELHQLIDPVYKQTNKRVMDVLINKYSLLNHFQAHRKYLLLGQGDFIHHFIDLLAEVLEKPADQLHPHHLNGILESAIRATSAQYDNETILNRLDAATLSHSRGDTGWDVFYLRYHVDGPIGTVFSLSKEIYQLLFYALWKAKRMEMILSKLWKKQITSSKFLKKVTDLAPLLKQCNELTSEMVHFIRQTQYYFLFEVLECSWNELLDEINESENLDEVISAHQRFLTNVRAGVFKDDLHEELSNQLCIVYDLVLQLHNQVDVLMSQAQKEVEKNVSSSDSDQILKHKEFTQKFIPTAYMNLKILAKTYRDTIKKFLLMLNSQNDLSLQLLSIRLDFNEHYKNLDSRLVAPLTFQHRRLSSMGDSITTSPLLPR